MIHKSIILIFLIASVVLFMLVGCSSIERKLLFYPTHRPHDNSLTPWIRNGEVIGYSRTVESPKNVWLMLHGNAGQASDRLYAVPSFSAEDSVFILEYPGYGNRKGVPSKEAFNRAANEAYVLLRETYPAIAVCVAAESIGSGPASNLSSLSRPPDKFVLIVPFDKLSSVAADHFPSFLVRLILKDNWDNVEALSNFKGLVEIIGAESDTIIPVSHAKALAAAIPGAKLTIIAGGHNDWSYEGRVRIRN
ncbi:MAG: alpha/beta hydrolase [Desulfobacterium sp.]|nr:alpha/beta hydrolase [Desulfobacterium sp.]MBU3947473.1 alpha/beta hydrolase [Pseudomonadota bacterium]MBU4036972.1 alpha/beta hydrolase [Pseudomonadota bacterium]